MKRILGVAAVLGILALGTAPARAGSTVNPACPATGVKGVMFDWDANCFAYETVYNTATFISTSGSQLVVVGKLTITCPPFDDLIPDALNEYTFVFDQLTSAGTPAPTVVGSTTIWNCNYGTGRFRIFKDAALDAPNACCMPAAPGGGAIIPEFENGTLILQGTLPNFRTQITKTGTNPANGSFKTDVYAYSPFGTLYSRTATVIPDISQGLWCVTSGCVPATYSAHPDGKFDAKYDPTTASRTSTWGSIKMLYR